MQYDNNNIGAAVLCVVCIHFVKEAEKIGDFLRMINAISALLYFEDIRIYRDHKNMTNRLNNCEQANMDKIFFTSNIGFINFSSLFNISIYSMKN